MRTIVFELCAESVPACVAAREGGADRIELCSSLDRGGLTPSHGLIVEAMERSGMPIHVMLRPRAGGFVYTAEEFAVMRRDLQHLRQLGAAGVVLGLLRADGMVDVERTAQLVREAGTLEVTFHRAFDEVVDLRQGLEDIIASGCKRVLTSGGKDDVVSGAVCLSRLVIQAEGRIAVAVGGGLRLHNASALAQATGATHFHGSLRSGGEAAPVDVEDVRTMLRQLRG